LKAEGAEAKCESIGVQVNSGVEKLAENLPLYLLYFDFGDISLELLITEFFYVDAIMVVNL